MLDYSFLFTHIMKRTLTIFAALMLSLPLSAQIKVVSHRGFYTCPGHETDENTIAALKEAQKLHPFAVEFDVHKTADGVLMINHNTQVNDELNCQTSTWKELKQYRLSKGGKFPTLEQWLRQAKKTPDIIMALELKTHATPERETEVVEDILKLVRKYDMLDQMAFLSFSLHACKEFARLAPGCYVVLNSSDKNEKVDADMAKELGIGALSYHMKVFNARPELIDRANEVGIDTYYWMVDDFKDLDWAIAHKCTHITSNFPDKMMKYIESKQ